MVIPSLLLGLQNQPKSVMPWAKEVSRELTTLRRGPHATTLDAFRSLAKSPICRRGLAGALDETPGKHEVGCSKRIVTEEMDMDHFQGEE